MPTGLCSAMNPPSHNPYQRERLLRFQNRVAEWRAHPDETLFHGLALLAAAALGVVILVQALPSALAALSQLITRWPLPLLAASLLLIHVRHIELMRTRRARLRLHWLAAQPIPASVSRRLLLRLQLFHLLAYCIGGGGLLYLVDQPPLAVVLWIAGCVIAIATANTYRLDRAGSPPSNSRLMPFAITSDGSFWRWQWIEVCAVAAPRRLAHALWLFLLAPAGHWSATVIALVLVLIYLLLAAWNSSVGVLVQADHWLHTQPLQTKRWLLDCLRVPLLILACISALIVLTLAATSSLRYAVPLLLGSTAVALLHYACAAAERRHPRRLQLVFAVHLLVLLAALQSLPFLLAPLWLAQMYWLIRRSLRK